MVALVDAVPRSMEGAATLCSPRTAASIGSLPLATFSLPRVRGRVGVGADVRGTGGIADGSLEAFVVIDAGASGVKTGALGSSAAGRS